MSFKLEKREQAPEKGHRSHVGEVKREHLAALDAVKAPGPDAPGAGWGGGGGLAGVS